MQECPYLVEGKCAQLRYRTGKESDCTENKHEECEYSYKGSPW